ncbi:MAG: M50 family metallopeptidase [Acidobacteriaceae bacterium]|nr:M50 family metallopeptidase [Acidobacteriaceae bacterium]MBV9502187.1 M50 family metallopeptidase [Acidobacteriaceae bacterium]
MQAVFPGRIEPPVPPVEERARTNSARSLFSWKLLLLAVVLGCAIEVAGPGWAQAIFRAISITDAGGISAIFAALFAAVVLHELGHFLAALAVGFRILGVSLGPVRVSFWHGQRMWKLSTKNLLTGSVSAIPRTDRQWRSRMLAVVAAGPAATLGTGALASYLLLAPHSSPWMVSFLGALSQLSFFLFVLGLIPNSAQARIRNDARLLLILWRDGVEADEIRTYHEIMEMEASGIRPGAIPPNVIRKLAVQRSSADVAMLCARTVVNWALDFGDIGMASAWDNHAFTLSTRCDERLRNSAVAASACFDILFRGDLDAARSKFATVQFEPLTPKCFHHRVKAAYWLAACKVPAALAEIAQARCSFSAKLPYYQFEARLLFALHHEALSMASQQAVACPANRG